MNKYPLSREWFSWINFYTYIRCIECYGTIVFSCSEHLETKTKRKIWWPWKFNFEIWPQATSGQGQVMTQEGRYGYLILTRQVWHQLCISTSILSRVISKELFVTSCDLSLCLDDERRISCIRFITNGVSGHDIERIWWFRLVYSKWETFSYYPIGLQWGLQKWPDLRSQTKNSEIYNI